MLNLTPDQLTALLALAFITGLVVIFVLWYVLTVIRRFRKYRAYYMARRGSHEAQR